MMLVKWILLLFADVIRMGVVNRSPGMSLTILVLLVLALLIVAANVSAPFIYTLF